ncbi:hypothetical protein LNQ03_05440 [Klebsiella pneumoniae subsp. pneumoniae]|nr:hypothetical protein [Klebsiella pneumoniae subsp. pneumoniae]
MLPARWRYCGYSTYGGPSIRPRKSTPISAKSELEYIKQDNEAPPVKQPFFTALKTVSKNKRFYGIAIPAFMAEPAWAVLSFWVPLYLAKEHGMDLKRDRHVRLAAVSRRRSRQRGQRLPHPPVCSLVRLYASELGDRQLGNRRVPDALPGPRRHHPRSLYHHHP